MASGREPATLPSGSRGNIASRSAPRSVGPGFTRHRPGGGWQGELRIVDALVEFRAGTVVVMKMMSKVGEEVVSVAGSFPHAGRTMNRRAVRSQRSIPAVNSSKNTERVSACISLGSQTGTLMSLCATTERPTRRKTGAIASNHPDVETLNRGAMLVVAGQADDWLLGNSVTHSGPSGSPR